MGHKPTHDGNNISFENNWDKTFLILKDGEIFVHAEWGRGFILETPEQAQRIALELLVGPGGTGTDNIDQAVRALRREFVLYDEERRKEQEKAEIKGEADRLREMFMKTPGAIMDVWSAVAEEARKIAQEKADAEEE